MRKVSVLIQKLSDDKDDDNMESSALPSPTGNSTSTPWHKDFNGYLYSKDQLGDMSIIKWWSVCISLVLLHDYAD